MKAQTIEHLKTASAIGILLGLLLISTYAHAAVRIAVIDSGATRNVDQALSFTSFSGSEDPLNHGTEIAGLIRKENPHATIYMLQVCEKVGHSLKPSKTAIINAIQWAIDNHIDVVNMSLVTKYSKEIDAIVTKATQKHGIVFIAAAGNKNLAGHFAAGSDGFIRRKTKATAPAFPSSNPHVISVGGLTSGGQIAEYSDKNCDVYADGEILGQRGSSFACARITAKIAQILNQRTTTNKSTLLSLLK